MAVLREEDFRKYIKAPKNKKHLENAVKHEMELMQFYSNKHPELVYKKVEQLVNKQKLAKFKDVYKNHSQSIINTVLKHNSKVFDAHGRHYAADFGENVEAETEFSEVRKMLHEGISDNRFWKTHGNKIMHLEPNSVFLTGLELIEDDGLIDLRITTKHIPLKAIWDVEASVKGIEYLVVKEKIEKENGEEDVIYHCYDDVNYMRFIGQKDGVELIFEPQPHELNRNPAKFASNVYDKQTPVIRYSVLSHFIYDLYTINILRTFYENYKYFSAFGKDIEPETFEDYTGRIERQKKKTAAIDPNAGWVSMQDFHRILKEGKVNSNVMGNITKIPWEMINEKDRVQAYLEAFKKIEADVKILEFHNSDLDRIQDQVVENIIGRGHGENLRTEAINQDQVFANFDDLESNLNDYKENVEETWNYNLVNAAKITSPSFVKLELSLGEKYFLKSANQLFAELDLMIKTTNNYAAIQQKLKEIILTQNKNNPQFIEREQIISILQPFQGLAPTYFQKFRSDILRRQPEDVTLFENFHQIIAIFEAMNGPIENFGKQLEMERRIERLKEGLEMIRKQYFNFEPIIVENGQENQEPGERFQQGNR